jgi:hypothetical protein
MDPYKHETFDQLNARKPGRLNILVRRLDSQPGTISDDGRVCSQPEVWHAVVVRYSYSQIMLPPNDPRPTGFRVPVLGERFDPTRLNAMKQLGACVSVPDIAGIERAVARLRTVWGADIPVQDNSGHVPHLATID